MTTNRQDWLWYEHWVECKCGKIRQERYQAASQREDDARHTLLKSSPCRTCSMEISKTLNLCPEGVTSPGQFSACKLGYHHTGPCEPWT